VRQPQGRVGAGRKRRPHDLFWIFFPRLDPRQVRRFAEHVSFERFAIEFDGKVRRRSVEDRPERADARLPP